MPAHLRARAVRRPAPLLVLGVLAFGCDFAADPDGARDAAVLGTAPERTVRITLLPVAERTLRRRADGSLAYPDATPLGGVEVCIAARRAAFDGFAPFEPIDDPPCRTSERYKHVRFDRVPADSDLIITYTKDGYEPLSTTFRTDQHDIGVPYWARKKTYFLPMLPAGEAERWLEPEPRGEAGDGMLAVWVIATGEWSVGESARTFASEQDPGVGQAEAVRVEIEQPGGAPIAELATRRDRPLFLRVPAGAYALRFSHEIGEVVPVGVQELFMPSGLTTGAFDTIEVPVLAGRMALAAVEMYCPLPADSRPFADLATCTLSDAGTDDMP